MRVKLLALHNIYDCVQPINAELDLAPGIAVTPLMLGLDDEARAAIKAEKARVFTRFVGPKWAPQILDNPPIEFPLDNPPVPPLLSESGGPPR